MSLLYRSFNHGWHLGAMAFVNRALYNDGLAVGQYLLQGDPTSDERECKREASTI